MTPPFLNVLKGHFEKVPRGWSSATWTAICLLWIPDGYLLSGGTALSLYTQNIFRYLKVGHDRLSLRLFLFISFSYPVASYSAPQNRSSWFRFKNSVDKLNFMEQARANNISFTWNVAHYWWQFKGHSLFEYIYKIGLHTQIIFLLRSIHFSIITLHPSVSQNDSLSQVLCSQAVSISRLSCQLQYKPISSSTI